MYEYKSSLQYFDYSIGYSKSGINKYPSLIVELANSGAKFFSESINFVVPSEELLYEFPSLYKLIYAGFIRENYNTFYDFCIHKSNLYFTFQNTIAKLGENDSMYRLIELDVLDKDAMVTSLDYCKEYLMVGTRGDGVLILKDDKMVAHFTQVEGLISDLINGCHVQ